MCYTVTMVLTRAQCQLNLLEGRRWPRVYDDVLMHWLHYFTEPLDSLESAGMFDLVLTQTRRFMVRDFPNYISNLAVKKRVQTLKYELYSFLLFVEQPGVHLNADTGKVRVSVEYWEQYKNGEQVPSTSLLIYCIFSWNPS